MSSAPSESAVKLAQASADYMHCAKEIVDLNEQLRLKEKQLADLKYDLDRWQNIVNLETFRYDFNPTIPTTFSGGRGGYAGRGDYAGRGGRGGRGGRFPY